MTVASLDLCKELYGLSGWDDNYFRHIFIRDISAFDADYWTVVDRQRTYIGDKERKHIIPAYDLGYLLRKLPHHTTIFLDSLGKWTCTYVPGDSDMQIAHTPEDAACKLAIELFKAGVLTKEKL